MTHMLGVITLSGLEFCTLKTAAVYKDKKMALKSQLCCHLLSTSMVFKVLI